LVHYDYKKLLEADDKFRRWYENNRRSSPSAADGRLRRIGLICRTFNLTPKQIAEKDVDEGADFIMDVVATFEKQGAKSDYIKNYVEALKNWFSFNKKEITQKIRLPRDNAVKVTKVSEEQSPVPEEVKKVLDVADQKQKVEIALIAFSGLRPESLGNHTGNDGLKLSDFPELKIDEQKKIVEVTKIPMMIKVRQNLSKAGHQYFSFLNAQGCDYLKQYLEFRLRDGEELNANSPVVTSLKTRNFKHITTTKISDSIRKAIRKAGFDWRPYAFRVYFASRLMSAESDGFLLRDWRVFMMGHKGDIEHVYTLNKKLPQETIEKMRQSYEKAAEKHLSTVIQTSMTTDKVLATFNYQFLKLGGYSDQEIEKFGDLSTLTPEQLKELLQDKSKQGLGLRENSQKIVSMAELRSHIIQGWEYVRDLPPDEAIIKLPSM